jgi:hypothetical protein
MVDGSRPELGPATSFSVGGPAGELATPSWLSHAARKPTHITPVCPAPYQGVSRWRLNFRSFILETRKEVPNMKRRLIVVGTAVLTMTLMAVVPANAGSSVTDSGLLLTGTDAAYATGTLSIDECHGLDVFVGYVEADRLLSPLGSGQPFFHTDLEASLRVYEIAEIEGCGSDELILSGVRGITDSDQVEMVTLESAFVHDFQLTVEGVEASVPVVAGLTINLDWAGDDNIRTETFQSKGDHSAHRTVGAAVSGTVTINTVTGGGELAGLLAGTVVSGSDLQDAQITHYQQILIDLP